MAPRGNRKPRVEQGLTKLRFALVITQAFLEWLVHRMNNKQNVAWILAALALSVVTVLAFSAGETGARTLTAAVVNDADAFLAIEANTASPHDGFVTVSGGKTTVTFDAANVDAVGTGINPDSTYMFDSILKITNKGTAAVTVDVTIAGTDASLCQVALTSASGQVDGDYAADPVGIASNVGDVQYLGLKFLGTGKASGDSVSCTINVVATR